jgi:beta-aspartyl-peptidase (threonine type)
MIDSERSMPTDPAPRRATQFSLKTLMWLVLLAAAFFSGWSVAVRNSQQELDLMRDEAKMARAAELDARYRAVAEREIRSQMSRAPAWQQTTTAEDLTADIEAVLRLQAEAWNAGDIDRFMEHYWKSDELTFSAGGQTTRGWKNTLERYRQRYPTIEKMGRLTFDQLEIQPLGETAAAVLGRWHLARDSDELGGNFSLVVRKIDGRWLIVHDHTSRAEKPAEQPPSEGP